MKIVDFAGQGEIFDAEIFRNDVDGLGAMLRIVLQSFQARFDKSEDFGRIVFDLLFRRADAARRISGEIISRVREPAETFTVENQLAGGLRKQAAMSPVLSAVANSSGVPMTMEVTSLFGVTPC